MTARFILSLDCEGKWGVADHLGRQEHATLSDQRLREAYRSVIDLLDELEIQATFAFVALFAEAAHEFRRVRPEVQRLAERAAGYLMPALDDIASGSGEGWHGDWAVDAVASAGAGHELALHGVTHVPWGSASRDFAAAELELLAALTSPIRHSKTHIFPRNQVAHCDLLPSAGIMGFRLAPPERSRLTSLASEMNVLSPPEVDPPFKQPLQEIPAGYFVNWRHGLRRAVPVRVSTLRVKQMLRRADSSDRVVHLWLHPENIASAPETLDVLREMLSVVARMRDSGRCEVVTQLDYCRLRTLQLQAESQDSTMHPPPHDRPFGASTSASPSTTSKPS